MTMDKLEKLIYKIRQEDNFYPFSSEPEVGIFLNSLIKLIGAKNVLELGTFKGATTLYLAEAVKHNGHGKVYTIDLKNYLSIHVKHSGLLKYIKHIIGSDLKVLKNLKIKFDLVFIDTSHELEQTLREFRLLDKIIKPGGLMAFHDSISHSGVKQIISYIHC